jgi:methylenetetrahydrofolate dehydrogenase (NADP+)/methenyltetrahydrofolate cyclohydrolase/formyltetrahydrofolate synthetase
VLTLEQLLAKIEDLNNDPSIHGILVQLPVPKHISEPAITAAVHAMKDVDGFGAVNIGDLAKRGGNPMFIPCTPKGVMVLLKEYGVDLNGKHAVVLGRSDIVGSPVSYLLKNANATVTICHSGTRDLPGFIKQADVLVSAIGQARFVKGEWLKPGVVVIDVGTNFVEDSTRKTGKRLVGDVDFEAAKQVASFITPVPGGVGPMTVAMLLENVVTSAERFYELMQHRKTVPLPLKFQRPVPSDIAVSRSQTPKNVKLIAHELGISDRELELYGPYKAKINLDLLQRLGHRRDGKYVLVAGITPTPLGEGKSVGSFTCRAWSLD